MHKRGFLWSRHIFGLPLATQFYHWCARFLCHRPPHIHFHHLFTYKVNTLEPRPSATFTKPIVLSSISDFDFVTQTVPNLRPLSVDYTVARSMVGSLVKLSSEKYSPPLPRNQGHTSLLPTVDTPPHHLALCRFYEDHGQARSADQCSHEPTLQCALTRSVG
jgi:hypothetical protein